MVRPGEVVELYHLVQLLAISDDLKLPSYQILHEALAGDQDYLHLLVALLELETFTNF